MTLLLPLLAFLSGLVLASTPLATRLKIGVSSLLARCFIPIVIVYNMVFYQAGSFSLMLFSFVMAVLLFYFFLYFSKNKLSALCFSYVNMAWLGFPFAIALFGTKISTCQIDSPAMGRSSSFFVFPISTGLCEIAVTMMFQFQDKTIASHRF